MAIITISRGSYSNGKLIAEKVAERLGYRCISRDFLLEASEEFNIPEVKLVRALHDAPSVLSRFTHGREKYIAYIQQAFLERVIGGSVVYHGLAGHFFLRGVDHALKVRIIADIEDRVRLEMEREGIDRLEAVRTLQKDDEERRRWSLSLYGIDAAEPGLYDLVVHVRKLTVDNAVDLICHTASLPQFERTPESTAALESLLLAARVRSAVVAVYPTAEISAEDGVVEVRVSGSLAREEEIAGEIRGLVGQVPGLRELRAGVRPRFGMIGRF